MRRTSKGAPSADEKPTHALTCCWGAVNVAVTGAVQNSIATQGSTATVPEWAKFGIAVGFEKSNASGLLKVTPWPLYWVFTGRPWPP